VRGWVVQVKADLMVLESEVVKALDNHLAKPADEVRTPAALPLLPCAAACQAACSARLNGSH
jgi:hypothetical protein